MSASIQSPPAIARSTPLPTLSHRAAAAALRISCSGSSRRLSIACPLPRRPRLPAAPPRARRTFSFREEDTASPADVHFEPPLEIVEYPDSILRARNKFVVFFDDNLKKLVREMFDVMYKTDGIGLSAPQVGINVQLMVFNPAGERGGGEEIVLLNPVIYSYSKKVVLLKEGCLSFPGIYADVERPASVKIDAHDISSRRFRINLSGIPARVFQHEFDHLQGILFFDRMSENVLESIRSDLKNLENKYEVRTGLECPERINMDKTRKKVSGFSRPPSSFFSFSGLRACHKSKHPITHHDNLIIGAVKCNGSTGGKFIVHA